MQIGSYQLYVGGRVNLEDLANKEVAVKVINCVDKPFEETNVEIMFYNPN